MENPDNIRIIFSDIDGTLLPFQGKDLTRTVDLAGELIAAGIDFVLCTGRGTGTIPKPFWKIRGLRYAVTGNGAMVWDLQKNVVLRERRITPKTAKSIIRAGRAFGIACSGYQHGHSYVDTACPMPPYGDNIAMNNWLRNARSYDLISLINRHGPMDKLLLFDPDAGRRNECRKMLEALPGCADLNYAESGVNALEISAGGATKGEAAEWLAGHLGLSRNNILGCGDNDNDVSMLKIAGISVVPSDGHPAARAAADVIVPPPEEDGVENWLEQLLHGERSALCR